MSTKIKPCKHYDYVTRFTNPDGSKCLDCGKYLNFDEVLPAAGGPMLDKLAKMIEEELKKDETPFGGKDYFLP